MSVGIRSAGMRRPKNTAVFISGGGSTLQALLELQHQFSIPLVVSNKKNILGLLKAKRFGRCHLLLSKECSFDLLTEKLKRMKIDQIFLGGYMKLLPATFVDEWRNKIFNIHPSLLPLYPGLKAAEKNYFDKKHPMGVTVHVIDEKMDEGTLFLQQVSLKIDHTKLKTLAEADILLRRTEQHLLREFIYRRTL